MDLDVGGGASQEKVAEAFKILLADDRVRGVLIPTRWFDQPAYLDPCYEPFWAACAEAGLAAAAAARDTLVARYNDLDSVEAIVKANSGQIAALFVEPIAGNMGLVPPRDGFLQGLRDICTREGIVLIFDEVISGFRAAKGGAQEVFKIRPDLTCLGKIIGGGLPVGAYGGRRDLMELVSPAGPVYQAGTLSGNPVAAAAGIAALDLAKRLDPYASLTATAARLADGLLARFGERGIPATANRAGSLLGVFFADGPVSDFSDAKAADHERYARFFHHMLERGGWLPPSGYELWTLGTEHGDRELETMVEAASSFELPA